MSDKSQVKVYLPKELHELLNADQRNNSEVVESALWREFGGKRKAVAEVQLEQKEKQLGAVRSEKDELETEESRLSQQVTALRERVNGLEDTEKELDTDLDELLTHLEDSGQHVWPNAENVRDLATAHNTDPEDIIVQLKERAAEEGRDIYHTQFQRADMVKNVTPRPIGEVIDNE